MIEVQAAMMGTHTTSTRHPRGGIAGEGHPFKSTEFTPLKMLRAPTIHPWELFVDQADPGHDVVMGWNQFDRDPSFQLPHTMAVRQCIPGVMGCLAEW